MARVLVVFLIFVLLVVFFLDYCYGILEQTVLDSDLLGALVKLFPEQRALFRHKKERRLSYLREVDLSIAVVLPRFGELLDRLDFPQQTFAVPSCSLRSYT